MCLRIALRRPNDVLASGEHAGHRWMVIHNASGYRCGYVRVDPGHPWHGKSYTELDESVNVHGGLTFSDPDVPCDNGKADDGHWFGSDCAHGGDLPDPDLIRHDDFGYAALPSILADLGVIRTQEYVENECRMLCEQAAAAV